MAGVQHHGPLSTPEDTVKGGVMIGTMSQAWVARAAGIGATIGTGATGAFILSPRTAPAELAAEWLPRQPQPRQPYE